MGFFFMFPHRSFHLNRRTKSGQWMESGSKLRQYILTVYEISPLLARIGCESKKIIDFFFQVNFHFTFKAGLQYLFRIRHRICFKSWLLKNRLLMKDSCNSLVGKPIVFYTSLKIIPFVWLFIEEGGRGTTIAFFIECWRVLI